MVKEVFKIQFRNFKE